MAITFSLILGFLAVRGFRFVLTEQGLTYRNTESFIWLLLLVFFTWICYRSIESSDKRLKRYAALFGGLIGIFYVLGVSYEKQTSVSWAWRSIGNALNCLNMLFGYAYLFYSFALLAFAFLAKTAKENSRPPLKNFSMKRVLIFWAILVMIYIPWYLYWFPGILTYDSGWQVRDAMTVNSLSDNNPAFVTLLIRAVILPVMALTGNIRIAVGVCTFLQMLILTFTFALSLERIWHYVRMNLFRVLIFLWYAAWPVNNIYSLTMWKDILFSGCLLCFCLCVDACTEDAGAFFRSRKKCFLIGLSMTLLTLLRHNGIFIVAVMSIYFLFRFKKYRRQAALIGFSALAIFGIWKLGVLSILNAKKVSSTETLAVPLQQVSRVASLHHNVMSPALLDELSEYFDIPEFWTEYWEKIADPIKAHFLRDLYNSDKGKFFRLWAELGNRYPIDYIEAFLHNNYGYWFPETTWWITGRGVIINTEIEGMYAEPILKLGIIDRIYNWYINAQYLKNPPLALLFKPGAIFWVWLFCGCYSRYRNHRKFAMFMPGFLLWLIILFSAVYCEFRYVYGLFVCLPLLLATVLTPPREDQVN